MYCFSLIYMATLRLICGPWDFHSAEACRIFTWALWDLRASQVELVVKNPPANAETSEMWAQSVSGGSPGGGHGSPVQDSCLGRPTDRGAWRAPVHRVAQSQTRLRGFAHTVSLVVAGGIFNLLLWDLAPWPGVEPGPPALRARGTQYLWLWQVGSLICHLWDLAPWPGVEPGPPALRARGLSHCTSREVLPCSFSGKVSSSFWFTF